MEHPSVVRDVRMARVREDMAICWRLPCNQKRVRAIRKANTCIYRTRENLTVWALELFHEATENCLREWTSRYTELDVERRNQCWNILPLLLDLSEDERQVEKPSVRPHTVVPGWVYLGEVPATKAATIATDQQLTPAAAAPSVPIQSEPTAQTKPVKRTRDSNQAPVAPPPKRAKSKCAKAPGRCVREQFRNAEAWDLFESAPTASLPVAAPVVISANPGGAILLPASSGGAAGLSMPNVSVPIAAAIADLPVAFTDAFDKASSTRPSSAPKQVPVVVQATPATATERQHASRLRKKAQELREGQLSKKMAAFVSMGESLKVSHALWRAQSRRRGTKIPQRLLNDLKELLLSTFRETKEMLWAVGRSKLSDTEIDSTIKIRLDSKLIISSIDDLVLEMKDFSESSPPREGGGVIQAMNTLVQLICAQLRRCVRDQQDSALFIAAIRGLLNGN